MIDSALIWLCEVTDDTGLKIVPYSLHGASSVMGVGRRVASMVQDIRGFQVTPPSGARLVECGLRAAAPLLLAPYCNTKVGGTARLIALCEPCPGLRQQPPRLKERREERERLWKEGKEQQEELRQTRYSSVG